MKKANTIWVVLLVIATSVTLFSTGAEGKQCSTNQDCDKTSCVSRTVTKSKSDMEKATSKAAVFIVFLVIASCVPFFSEAMVIKRRCSTTADCETFPCYSKEFKRICINNLCECKIPNSDGSAQTTENENPCSSQKDCDKIDFLCRSGTLKCVNGKCICVGVN
ncbi:hypothetical protein PRUPE_5G016900 [Prunus persica]|uniref:Uncharacterized protein n=1 Tax=Prunus persica TaxID=3760 RepID=A0A251P243_PRUPE|nr:hypothetical protein PRUPE_5G016900 [Prunus persica]